MSFRFFLLQQRQKILLVILIILIVIAAVVVWYAYFRQDVVVFVEINASPVEEVTIDFSIFDDPIFQELGSPITEIPLPEAEKRANPFIAN